LRDKVRKNSLNMPRNLALMQRIGHLDTEERSLEI